MTFEEFWENSYYNDTFGTSEPYYGMARYAFEVGYETANNNRWHFTIENDYPPLKELPNGETYNLVVCVFWYNYDDYGKGSRVYDLDRWIPELKKWETHEKDNIVAWDYMPEVKGVK